MCASAALLIQNAMDESNNFDIPPLECSSSSTEGGGGGGGSSTTNPKKLIITDNGGGGSSSSSVTTSSYYSNIEQVRKQTSRDRNREHARCTRLRKKIYVNKLKELVDELHTERNDDTRKQRVAVQQLAELQSLRRKVLHTFLDYHAKFENEYNKWALILECSSGGGGSNSDTADESSNTDEGFWFKQPVTPYRSFRRSEIQKVRNRGQKNTFVVFQEGVDDTLETLLYNHPSLQPPNHDFEFLSLLLYPSLLSLYIQTNRGIVSYEGLMP